MGAEVLKEWVFGKVEPRPYRKEGGAGQGEKGTRNHMLKTMRERKMQINQSLVIGKKNMGK